MDPVAQFGQELSQLVGRVQSGYGDDGYKIASILSHEGFLRRPIARALSNRNVDRSTLESTFSRVLRSPWDRVAAGYVSAANHAQRNNAKSAFEDQLLASKNFRQILTATKEQHWPVSVMQRLVKDLRKLAILADENAVRPTNIETAMGEIRECFIACNQDKSPSEVSKKWGLLFLMNELFSIAFKINQFAIINAMLGTLKQPANKPFMNTFSKADRVTYAYYTGRKAMFDARYSEANTQLTFALKHCHRSSRHNKRLILIYLTPVKLLVGELPSNELLSNYNLPQFRGITEAVRKGNLLALRNELETHQAFFIQWGIYLVLEKLRFIAYRNLFKKVHLMLGSPKILISSLQTALSFMKETSVDDDELECIVANLIHQNYIKGYISHSHRTLVVSKTAPFPAITQT